MSTLAPRRYRGDGRRGAADAGCSRDRSRTGRGRDAWLTRRSGALRIGGPAASGARRSRLSRPRVRRSLGRAISPALRVLCRRAAFAVVLEDRADRPNFSGAPSRVVAEPRDPGRAARWRDGSPSAGDPADRAIGPGAPRQRTSDPRRRQRQKNPTPGVGRHSVVSTSADPAALPLPRTQHRNQENVTLPRIRPRSLRFSKLPADQPVIGRCQDPHDCGARSP